MKKKRKPAAGVEHRLTKLEQDAKTLYREINAQNDKIDKQLEEIKKYVSNHIVHSLDETKAKLEILLNRKNATDAVKTFLNNCVKLALTITGFTWSVLNIIKYFKN